MRRFILLSFLVFTCVIAQDGFKPIVNGNDFTGWDAR
jgi:hypothetical protein